MEVPQALRRYFADSTLRLHGYCPVSNELTIRIEKEIGPESGLITLEGVSYLSIPDCFAGDRIDSLLVRDVDESFWNRTSCDIESVEANQTVYRFYDQDGPIHFVVGESLRYDIDDLESSG